MLNHNTLGLMSTDKFINEKFLELMEVHSEDHGFDTDHSANNAIAFLLSSGLLDHYWRLFGFNLEIKALVNEDIKIYVKYYRDLNEVHVCILAFILISESNGDGKKRLA